MNIAIVGGGAAGFFLAIHVKEILPQARVVIIEKSSQPLSKVKMSGGGRCNVTNSFALVSDLAQVYPRGAKLLKRLFASFNHEDAFMWFENHGVPLVTQDDECVFPRSQNSESIILCLRRRAKELGIVVQTKVSVEGIISVEKGLQLQTASTFHGLQNEVFHAVALTTGGASKGEGHDWLAALGHRIEPPCPSLFTFNIADRALNGLMGIVVEEAVVSIPNTKFRGEGPLLITHWGLSGPSILKLSSHAARHLHEKNYRSPLLIAWAGSTNSEVAMQKLLALQNESGRKQMGNVRPDFLQTRLWHYLLQRAGLSPEKQWGEVGRKGLNRLANVLTADAYTIMGQGTYKEEFVTCGGVSLKSVHPSTLESKTCPGLFFAGEVLDIDGVTGGFNFTAAWSTAYAAAHGIATRLQQEPSV